jgi:hypothetical protein
MSTTSFTRIENTVVSGSSLVAGLSNDEWTQILFDRNLDDGKIVVPSTGTTGYFMTLNDVTKAVAGVRMVDGSVAYAGSVVGCGVINFGSDLASVAKNYQNYLNLTSVGHSRVMSLQLQNISSSNGFVGTLTPATIVASAGAGSSLTFLKIDSTNALATLFGTSSKNGSTRMVTVSAMNVTAGSESVNFEIDSLTSF